MTDFVEHKQVLELSGDKMDCIVGMFICGMSLPLSVYLLKDGCAFNVFDVHDRQKVLTLFVLMSSVLLSMYFPSFFVDTTISTVLGIFVFGLTHLMLAIINHNALDRMSFYYFRASQALTEFRAYFFYACVLPYNVPLLIATAQSLINQTPIGNDPSMSVYGYLHVAACLFTHTVSIGTDLVILKNQFVVSHNVMHHGKSVQTRMLRPTDRVKWFVLYGSLYWIVAGADIILKLVGPNPFYQRADLSLTVLAFSIRAGANLKHGLFSERESTIE